MTNPRRSFNSHRKLQSCSEKSNLTLNFIPSSFQITRIMCAYSLSCAQLFVTPWTVARQAPLSMGFSRQNTGVSCHGLLQGIFPTQGLNPGLLHCRWILYQLSYQGSPRILEWVCYLFSRGSSRPRNQTGVSCIIGGFLTSWAIREDHMNDHIKS